MVVSARGRRAYSGYVKRVALVVAVLVAWSLSACGGGAEDAEPATTGDGVSLDALPTCGMTTKDMASKTMTPVPAAGRAVSSGDRASNLVALTFDLSENDGPAMETMAWLSVHQVPATIFVRASLTAATGELGRQVLRMADARRDLFTLGNAGYAHLDLRSSTAGAVASDLTKAELALAKYARQEPRPYFRPLAERPDAAVVTAAAAAGYTLTVLWDVDGGAAEDDANEVAAAVLAGVQGGSIVRLPLGGAHTAEALPAIVDGLRARGLEPVTLERMFSE